MYRKLGNLGFVIGIFFITISLILLIGTLVSSLPATSLNLYTGFVFLAFGGMMAFFNKGDSEDKPAK